MTRSAGCTSTTPNTQNDPTTGSMSSRVSIVSLLKRFAWVGRRTQRHFCGRYHFPRSTANSSLTMDLSVQGVQGVGLSPSFLLTGRHANAHAARRSSFR